MAKVLRMDGELDFSDTGWGDDFEADCGVVLEGRPEDAFDDIWFKAYDLAADGTDRETALANEGYKYECEVMVRLEGDCYGPRVVAPKHVRTREEAESYLAQVYEGIRDGSVDVPLED